MTAHEREPLGNLRSRVLHGIAWKVVSQVVVQLSRVVVAIVLARLLSPHDYGLAAMVLVFAALIFIFSDLAFGAALVQRRSISEQDRSTAFWMTFAGGLAFTLIGLALSGPIARLYGEPEVRPLFAALSLSFFVTALGTTQKALLTREMDFRRLEVRLMVGTVAAAAAGIVVAAFGGGAWAIIAQQLVLAAVSTALLWLSSSWRPRLQFSVSSLRSMSGFTGNVLGTQILFYVSRSTDNFLIGRFLGSAAVGAYALAYNLVAVPLSRVGSPIQEVLFPVLSRLQDDRPALASAWLRVNRLVAALCLPALLGLVIVAPEFVVVVLGRKWEAAIPVIQILAWAGLLQSLQRVNSSVLQACNRTGTLFRFSIVASTMNVTAFAVGLQWGIVGVAAAYALTNTFLQPFYTWLTARTVGLSFASTMRSVSGVVQASLLMAGGVFLTRALLLEEGVADAASLAVCVVVGLTLIVPFMAWRAPDVVTEIRGVIRRKRPPGDPLAKAQPSQS
ncbi:MAG: MOP flippase family protein [Gaiellaceae bacterium]